MAAVLISCYPPWWRVHYADVLRADMPDEELVVLFPTAVVGGCLAVAALALTGRRHHGLRYACRVWLVITVLCCGAVTGGSWFLQATDPYRQEDGLRATHAGEGLVLGLAGCVLIPLGGALGRRDDP